MSRLAFPFRASSDGRSATVTYGSASNVRQMLELLVLTVTGERVMRPDFGSPVAQMLFRPGDGPVATALAATLQATIAQWLGHRLEVQDLAVEFLEDDAALDIRITYYLLAEAADDSITVEARLA